MKTLRVLTSKGDAYFEIYDKKSAKKVIDQLERDKKINMVDALKYYRAINDGTQQLIEDGDIIFETSELPKIED